MPLRGVERGHHDRVLRRDAERDGLAHHPVDVAVRRRCPRGRGRRCRRRSGSGRTRRASGRSALGCAPSRPRGSAATSRPAAARAPRRRSGTRGRSGCRRRRRPAAPCPTRPGAWPSTCSAPASASFSSSDGAPATTPGKFIISARPSTRLRRISASRSPGARARRGDSNGDAGTHDGAMKNTSSWRSADASSSQWTPSVPSTFAISCGSATTAVVPSGSTRRANSSTSSFTDSRCMCASMKPGHDVAARRVDHLGAVVLADPGDHAVDDRDVRVEPLAGEHAEHAAAADDGVGGLVARERPQVSVRVAPSG